MVVHSVRNSPISETSLMLCFSPRTTEFRIILNWVFDIRIKATHIGCERLRYHLASIKGCQVPSEASLQNNGWCEGMLVGR